MAPPSPPVALKDHCSIIYNNILYVYSPDAFQTLPLVPNTQWSQEANGVSVIGATCVQGGIDGDNTQPALYVVGGTANASSSSYPGLQRYSILDKSWQTITPVVPVTQNRVHHGAAYMNASSSLVVYAGSQNGDDSPSTETFLMEMYPPYRVQAYSSAAPPVADPIMLAWSESQAVMVGGGSSNQQVFTFDPADGWLNLGLSLPAALPNYTVAQSALITLDDSSKVLETFDLGQSPPSVTRYVLLNPGGLPAVFGETVGNPTSSGAPTSTSAAASRNKRAIFLDNFPTYGNTFAPTGTRTGFSLAQGDNGLITILGGDQADSIVLFNGTGNAWLNANQVLSANPQATSSTNSASPTSSLSGSTPSQTAASTSSGSSSGNKSHGLTILGAALGAICGAAAILIIALLWLRSIKRRRAHEERHRRRSDYPTDNKRRSGGHSFEEQGLQPLSKAGQPMGRSPVTSAVVEPDLVTSFNTKTAEFNNRAVEKPPEKRLSSALGHRLKLDSHVGSGMGFGQGMFKRDKSPLSISRPMYPDLGDYKDRPSIELGHATPAMAPGAVAAALPARNFSQRKTDEGWAKYFQADNSARLAENRGTYTSHSSGSTGRGKGSFWPGAGVPEGPPIRSPKLALRDSSGNALHAQTVASQSPNLENGPAQARARGLEVVQGIPAQISSGESVSSGESHDHDDDDDDYEDEKIEHAYSSGVPSSIPDLAWTPIGNTWSGPPQRPVRPPSSNVSSAYPSGVLPLPTSTSHETSNSSGTKRSSIPLFPMPNSTIRAVNSQAPTQNSPSQATRPQPPAVPRSGAAGPSRSGEDARGYFDPGPGRDGMPKNSNLSWLNLNADPR